MIFAGAFLVLALVFLFLLAQGLGFGAVVVTGAAGLATLWFLEVHWIVITAIGVPFVLALLAFGLPVIRRSISAVAMKFARGALPAMSETERVALEAGTVWWDAELFSGKPDWDTILDFETPSLSKRERDFLAGPVEELCAMLDNFEVEQQDDLPPEAWDFVRENRFFGMIIPEEYGGLGFSALMHSAVVTKVASHSVTASVTVMVPNSLGPAELLLHYGTDEQKKHYLPRLARGEEIPCFALTEPNAGSDAASIQSEGIVCKDEWEGKEIVGIRLNWNKRYITLAPVATVLGLAFRLRDPDHLLGDEEDLGITCALISPDLPGVETGERHDPLRIPFMNGPTRGENVFVPIDAIIGGEKMAGQGWLMLMQCLAAGRSISLPALSTGAAQLATRVVSAYGIVREQFNLNIGAFEGVEEKVARIAGTTYMMSCVRVLTAGAVDTGQKPAVISAIAKAYMTELMRVVINDAMDIQGGAAICRGPRNTLASAYSSIPVGITVEGANILTRTLIIYGQGAMRCHPFVLEQLESIAQNDLARFDRAFFGHVGFTSRNAARAFLLGISGGAFASAPVSGVAGYYFRCFERMSAGFATLSDAAMGIMQGSLKRREKISGRFADALAWMYLGTCVLKRYTEDGQPAKERPFVEWSCQTALHEIQTALVGILDNFPARVSAALLRRVVFPFGPRFRPPSDSLGAQVSRTLFTEPEIRERLTSDIFVPEGGQGLGLLESALKKVLQAQGVMVRVREAVRAGKLEKKPRSTLVSRALEAGVIEPRDADIVAAAEAARDEAVQVDAFNHEPEGAALSGLA